MKTWAIRLAISAVSAALGYALGTGLWKAEPTRNVPEQICSPLPPPPQDNRPVPVPASELREP
jgi:hypothetical protein